MSEECQMTAGISGFPAFETLASGGSRGKTDSKVLEVKKVGKFDASFVPAIKDFSRMDERFRLPMGVWDKLPMYKEYGFAVFQLMKEEKGAQKVHPMAFEFPRANSGKPNGDERTRAINGTRGRATAFV